MKTISILKNRIQEYEWGSHTAIADLLGQAGPSEKPQAELWMGAHPKAPSQVQTGGAWISLLELIENNPVEMLGSATCEKFNRRMPYLFKVLAADRPLSVQAHPLRVDARRGFSWENRRGIPLDAARRNYRDSHEKPECLCALTRFWGVNGFRPVGAIAAGMRRVCPVGLAREIQLLEKRPDSKGLEAFFSALMTLEGSRKKQVLREAVRAAAKFAVEDPAFGWMIRLHEEYPEDIGIFSPVVLNLVCLEPGQAMFLSAGELHAYFRGVGMELMGNSDNVLRGGLTHKHMDVPELLRILTFSERSPAILSPQRVTPTESVYACPVKEFVLSVIRLDHGGIYTGPAQRSIEIMLCVKGTGDIVDDKSRKRIRIGRGLSVVIPAAVRGYTVIGKLTAYKAAVPV